MKARVVDVRAVKPTSEKIVVAELSEEEKAQRAREAADEEHRQALVREREEATREIEQLREDAKREAQQTLAAARTESVQIAEAAAREAADAEGAKLAATWMAVREYEAHASERALDRTVELAQLLAERLVGRALDLDADVIAALARGVLQEAREARPLVIEVHPADVDALRGAVASGGLQDTAGVAIEPTPAIERGSLSVRTELGVVDAALRARLSRLAGALIEALRMRGG